MNKRTYFNPLYYYSLSLRKKRKKKPSTSAYVDSNLIANYSKMTAIWGNFAIILILAPPVARRTTQYALYLRT